MPLLVEMGSEASFRNKEVQMAQADTPTSIEAVEALLRERTETDAVPGLSVSVVKGERAPTLYLTGIRIRDGGEKSRSGASREPSVAASEAFQIVSPPRASVNKLAHGRQAG
jgi:hypothetical protein